MPPFCYSPWTNLDISPQGIMAPCCKFRYEKYPEQFNINSHTIKQYQASDMLDEVKADFQKGHWPRGCERCHAEESMNLESKRILDYARWKEHYDQYDLSSNKFITASVAFGNTCNLKCITCGPHSSSRWQEEYKKIFGKDVPPNHFYKDGFVNEFIESFPDPIHLDIPGGEPFLSGVDCQQQLMHHYVSTGKAKDIGLHYTTNGSIFPSDEWWSLWKNFQDIDMQLSIDAVGEHLEYIRHPIKWKTLLNNVERYLQKDRENHNLRLSISVTVSAFNVFYLDELLGWLAKTGLPKPWLGRVHTPVHMRPTIWPDPARSYIIEKLASSDHDVLHSWANILTMVDDSEHFNDFVVKVKAHDQYRGTDFRKTFPEMADYL